MLVLRIQVIVEHQNSIENYVGKIKTFYKLLYPLGEASGFRPV